MQRIYEDGTYLQHNPSWHEEDSWWKAQKIKKIIQRNHLSPTTICEVGCGAGEILNQLLEQLSGDIEYVGYEVSPQAFELCRTKLKNRLTFVFRNLLEENERFFDLVLAIDVFEHVDDYLGFLRKLKTKGQYTIFHIPLDVSVQTVLRGWPLIWNRQHLGHLHYFTKDTALAALRDTGYEVIDHFYTSWALELPNRAWRRRLLRIPRKSMFMLSEDLAVRLFGGYSLMVLTK